MPIIVLEICMLRRSAWVYQYDEYGSNPMAHRSVNVIILILFLVCGCSDPGDERIESADILFERAVQYTERGRYDEAVAAFENLLDVDTDIGRTRRVAKHELHLGIIAERTGRFEDAREWYLRSIENSRRAASHEGIIDGMDRLAQLAANGGDFQEELMHYQSALTYTEFFNYPTGEAIISMRLGKYESNNGRVDIAHHYFTRATQIAANQNDPALQYTTLIALADNYIQRGNYNEAYNRLQEAEQFDALVDDQTERIKFVLTSGKLYEQAGRYGEALSVYEEGWNVHREHPRNDEYFLRLLEALADGYLMHGRYRDALSYYNLLTDLSRSYDRQLTLGYALLGKSDGYVKRGIVVDNNEYIEHALQLARETEAHFGHLHYFTGQAYAVFQQARCVSLLGRTGEAIGLYINALSFLTETITPEGVFYSQNRFEQRNNLTDPHIAITNFLVNELVQAQRHNEAFRYTERDRQSTLNEKVMRIGLASSNEQVASLGDSLTQLYRKMRSLDYARLKTFERSNLLAIQRDTLRSMISYTRNKIEELQDTLSDSLPNSRRLFDKDVPSLTSFQHALPAGRTLVSYFATHTHLHTFVLTRGSLRVQSQELPVEVLEARANAFRRLISSPLLYASEEDSIDPAVEQEYTAHAGWIYDIFIQPMLSLAEGLQHAIVIMPTGLHDLPLHALHEPRGNREYIVNKFSLSYLPSATVLTFRLQSPSSVRNIAAFGNPDGSDWSVDYEIRDIRGIYRDARIYLEANATIERLKAERGDILHLTSEFYFQPHFPEHSHFLLTQEGSITVRQFGLEHLTGLYRFPNVILYNSGEVIEGLNIIHPYLLYLNGSRSVVVNYWTREARSAKWFNENIYSNLSIEHPFTGAFHEAQKTLISTPDYAHPHFWALFFLYSL